METFCVTGPLCGEFTGRRWIPHTKASDAELWCFLWSVPEYTVEEAILRRPVNSPHKDQGRGALIFSLICAWINDWRSNREAGDLRRCHAHYEVTQFTWQPPPMWNGCRQSWCPALCVRCGTHDHHTCACKHKLTHWPLADVAVILKV